MATLSIGICGRRISERRTGLPVPGKEVTNMFRIVNRLIQWTGNINGVFTSGLSTLSFIAFLPQFLYAGCKGTECCSG